MDIIGIQKYSIWLVPDRCGDSYKYFSRLINFIKKERILRYETDTEVIYEPHVTLIGNLFGEAEEVTAKASKLASIVNPFTVELTSASYRQGKENFYRSLFVGVETTGELASAFSKACEIFQRLPEECFEPHLSLAYGEMTPRFKRDMLDMHGNNFANFSFLTDRLHLRLSLHGDDKSWVPIKEFPLRAS